MGAITLQSELAVSETDATLPAWSCLSQWQVEAIYIAISPISGLTFIHIVFSPGDGARLFTDEVAAACLAARAHVTRSEAGVQDSISAGIELLLPTNPGPDSIAVWSALEKAGIEFRTQFKDVRGSAVVRIGPRPVRPVPRTRAEALLRGRSILD
jgi:hypothetical protein